MWTLNPTTFLPTEVGTPNHNCEEVIDEIYLSRPDLKDIPFQNPELELFTNRSSFIQDRQHRAGYAIITADKIVKAEALPPGWSAQAEPRALAQVLRHTEGSKSTSILIQATPLLLYTYMEPFIKKEDYRQWGEKGDDRKQKGIFQLLEAV